MYDAPPADHAWRLELNDVMGDTTLVFPHNTGFTDIMWKNKLTVQFMNMNPHVGQDFHLEVNDKETGENIREMDTVAAVDFMISVYGIEIGKSYDVDFYADHNGNGIYDAPPADHAWRMELIEVMGDTTLMFTHNTNFTDISVSTGISDNLAGFIKLFPNPASEKVIIETGKFTSSNIHVKVFDIAGKLKISQIHSFNQQLKIDVHHLVNGLYFIELSNENQREMLKFMKN
jgi:hypothetical protein